MFLDWSVFWAHIILTGLLKQSNLEKKKNFMTKKKKREKEKGTKRIVLLLLPRLNSTASHSKQRTNISTILFSSQTQIINFAFTFLSLLSTKFRGFQAPKTTMLNLSSRLTRVAISIAKRLSTSKYFCSSIFHVFIR